MHSSDEQSMARSPAVFLHHVRAKGVQLWTESGRLYYKAPKGVLSREEFEQLKKYGASILSLLEAESRLSADNRVQRLKLPVLAPITFSQLAHWNLCQLTHNPARRHLTSATELCGDLDIDSLQQALGAVVRKHGALRTLIPIVDGSPLQHISESTVPELEVKDLSGSGDGSIEADVHRYIEDLILEPIDPAAGPLFGTMLLKTGESKYVLLLAMEHIISDAFSMNVLLRDLGREYVQIDSGQCMPPPPASMQFAEYALRQSEAHQQRLKQHGAYWAAQLLPSPRIRFPDDQWRHSTYPHIGWGCVPLRISKPMKEQLRNWCRHRGTTIVLAVFTAYVATVMRWCEVSEGVIQYQSDGRELPETHDAIGYFAQMLYVHVALSESTNWLDFLSHVTTQYCLAYDCADDSYLASRTPRPAFCNNPTFNWIPEQTCHEPFERVESAAISGEITSRPVNFDNPVLRSLDLDHEPEALFYDTPQGVDGSVVFPLERLSNTTMERFSRNVLSFLSAMLNEPGLPVICTPLIQ